MKILGTRRDTSSSPTKSKRLPVDILGRGRENLTVTPQHTVRDLRTSLNIGNNVRAVDEQGNVLSDISKVHNKEEINFVPNVKGGSPELEE